MRKTGSHVSEWLRSPGLQPPKLAGCTPSIPLKCEGPAATLDREFVNHGCTGLRPCRGLIERRILQRTPEAFFWARNESRRSALILRSYAWQRPDGTWRAARSRRRLVHGTRHDLAGLPKQAGSRHFGADAGGRGILGARSELARDSSHGNRCNSLGIGGQFLALKARGSANSRI